MTEPLVEVLPIEQAATPDQNNINRHTQRGQKLVENSLRKRGAFRSIASAGKGVEVPVTYAGNLTLETAVAAGFKEIVNVHVRGDQLVNVVRDDVEPGSAEAIALGLEDNESGKQSYNPDIDLLAQMAAGDDTVLAKTRAEDVIFSQMLNGLLAGYDNYSRKIEAPTYTPSGEKPKITDLFDDTKTRSLIEEIDKSGLPEDEKNFLRIAAQRHTVLSFKKIADYYAHSGEETQELMENSALIIIDIKKAISLGLVKLTEDIRKMVKDEYGDG